MEFVDHIYYLGDYDVYGFDIFCFYTFGDSQCQGLLSKIHLLPLYPFNSEVYEEALLFPFDKVDEKKAKSILEKSYFKDIPHLSERT